MIQKWPSFAFCRSMLFVMKPRLLMFSTTTRWLNGRSDCYKRSASMWVKSRKAKDDKLWAEALNMTYDVGN